MKTQLASILFLCALSIHVAHGTEESGPASSLGQAILRPGTGEYDFPAVECDLQWFVLQKKGKLTAIPANAAPMPSKMRLNRVRNYGVGTSVYFHESDVFGRYTVMQIPRLPDLNVVGKIPDHDTAVHLLGQPYVRWRNDWLWGFLSGTEGESFSVMIVCIRFDAETSSSTKWIATAKIIGREKSKDGKATE